MNENTLVVVHCYAAESRMIETFMPAWAHHSSPILFLSPEDAPVEYEMPDQNITYAVAGERGWKGPQTVFRQIEHWRLALAHPSNAQWFLLNDSDSMCLSPEIPRYLYADPSKLWCNVLCHENEHRDTDNPNLNPPYFMSREYLQTLLNRADELDDLAAIAPYGHHEPDAAIDGFYSYLVIDDLHMPYGDFPDGITTWPRGRPDLFKFTAEGAVFIHGVKTSHDLDLFMLNHRAWQLARTSLSPDRGMYEGDTVTVQL